MRLRFILVSQVLLLLVGCAQQLANVSDPAPSAETTAALLEPPPANDPDIDDLVDLQAAKSDLASHDNLVDRVVAGMTFSRAVEDQRVQKYLDYYSRNQDYVDRVFNRGNRYLYHIVEQLEARGMPAELALLPIVESAFNPFAYSHSGASGLWQFIPSTASHYGLRQDWWYEGRRDLVDSTAAALTYLDYLHKLFDGDWLLALAAYNSGEGNVRKAIAANGRRGRPTDFWSLDLPQETRAYVPQLVAIAKILNNPNRFGLKTPVVSNSAYFQAVTIKEQIDLAQAAKLAGISVEEIYLLNPGYNRWLTPPGRPNRLLLPANAAESFTQLLAEAPKQELRTEQRYVVRPGDTLGQIASRHHIGLTELKSLNRMQSSLIRPGQVLIIAGTGADRPLPFQVARPRYYRVRTGDSLWKIAKKLNVTVRDLQRWNNLGRKALLRPGQQLTVRAPVTVVANASSTASSATQVDYAVTKGDSLFAIAQRYNIRIRDILSWNSIDSSAFLQPGQILRLYPN